MTEKRHLDVIDELRAKIGTLTEYDYRSLDVYAALSFYLAQRAGGVQQGAAAQATCENFGHDAPRGLCLRCGIGAEVGGEKPSRDYAAERQKFLAERGR